jgi:cytochrome c biogenesis protein CcdA
MKIIIYISGISAGLLFLLALIGFVADFSQTNLILITATALLLVVFLPLMFYDRYKSDKKMNELIKMHAARKDSLKKGESKIKGWNMNNSPFTKRKSGLSWGGGNIHAANASRGSRKRFLK